MVSHCIMHHNADLESSTQLNSGTVMGHHMSYYNHSDGINGMYTSCWCMKMCYGVWCCPKCKWTFIDTAQVHSGVVGVLAVCCSPSVAATFSSLDKRKLHLMFWSMSTYYRNVTVRLYVTVCHFGTCKQTSPKQAAHFSIIGYKGTHPWGWPFNCQVRNKGLLCNNK